MFIEKTARQFSNIAAVALVGLMLIGLMEVVMRLFSKSIPGAFEISGFLGVFVASFAVAETALLKGHIAVVFVLQKLPLRRKIAWEGTLALLGGLLFLAITYGSFLYALQIYRAKEVSMTIAMPTYPFVLGLALGLLLLAIVLLAQSARSYKRLLRL